MKSALIFGIILSLHPQVFGQLFTSSFVERIEQRIRANENVSLTTTISVSSRQASEFPDYDTLIVTFDNSGKTQVKEFLISRDQKTLVEITRIDLSVDPYAEVMKRIDSKGRPARGREGSKVKVVVYDDFQCPFCAHLYRTLFPELLNEYGGRVLFIYKDFPISEIHAWAMRAAVNANCLAAQSSEAYWDFADYIHANQLAVNSKKDLNDQFALLDQITMTEASKFVLNRQHLQSCVSAQNDELVKQSIKEGESLGVAATPTIFVNGEMMSGAQPASEFRAAFDRALHDVDAESQSQPRSSAPIPASAESASGGAAAR